MLNPVFRYLYLLSFLFLAVCQPIQYSVLEPSQAENILKGPYGNHEGISKQFLNSRSGVEEFKNTFSSNKLDLVFVLDTSPSMENFYQNNLFGSDFLNRFQAYDWRFAYTDMSVEVARFLKQKKQEEAEKEEDTCPFLSGLFMTTGGLLSGQPLITVFGLRDLGECLSKLSEISMNDEEIEAFTNGYFLPFEHRGQKLDMKNLNYLAGNVENYNEIFNHTVRLGNEKEETSYDAPEQKDQKAYPFLSMIFSLSKGSFLKNKASQSEPTLSFFRDDSVIVYVLVTVHDLQAVIEPVKLKQSIESSFSSEERKKFGSENWMKIIPVTLIPDSSLICQLHFQNTQSTDTSKIRKLASEFGSKALDICSKNLANELFTEISKSLYPTDFLNN